MKRMLACLLCVAMLVSVSIPGASAMTSVSVNVTVDSWSTAELLPLYVLEGGELYSELNEDYYEYWWEEEVPELDDNYAQACPINMRGFAMSPDGRYCYMGTLNGGSGVRGVVVYDTKTCKITDLYYHYDGAAGDPANPFSYAKGIAADDRGYVYAGFAFSKNYNIVNLGIAQQQEDGTLEEVYCDAVYEFGNPGDTGGIHVGVNGVDVAKVGDKYYCYVMTNYTYDALYCYDVTDPTNPVLNKDFGTNGCIIFSEPSNTVGGDINILDLYYMDVDEDGTIWIITDTDKDVYVMKITPDGSAAVELIVANSFFCVEHVSGYLLLGDYKGGYIEVRDDASYEVIAQIPILEDYGDRVVRIQIANDVMFVCEAGNDNHPINTIHAAPLSADGQAFFDQLVANLAQTGEEDTEAATEPTTEAPTEGTEAPTEVVTEAPTDAPADVTDAATEAPTETEASKSGCGATMGFAAVAILTACAAFVACRKENA